MTSTGLPARMTVVSAAAVLFTAVLFTTVLFAASAVLFTAVLFTAAAATVTVSTTGDLEFGFRQFSQEAIGLVQGGKVKNRNLRHGVFPTFK
jgi:hypothetical protein